jgi:predicted peroxiredoxin
LTDIATFIDNKSKIYLLIDGCHPVADEKGSHENQRAAEDFVTEMRRIGVNITTTQDVFKLIRGEELSFDSLGLEVEGPQWGSDSYESTGDVRVM